jgi:hypothetical protein
LNVGSSKLLLVLVDCSRYMTSLISLLLKQEVK